MTHGEIFFLALVVGAWLAFAAVLAYVSWLTNRAPQAHEEQVTVKTTSEVEEMGYPLAAAGCNKGPLHGKVPAAWTPLRS